MQKKKQTLVSSLLVLSLCIPFNVFAEDTSESKEPNQNQLETLEQEETQQAQAEENLLEPTKEKIEVISTEENNDLYGMSDTIATKDEKATTEEKEVKDTAKAEKEKKKKEKEEKEKEKKDKADKDAKDPYSGENLKKEKPRHYNTIYKGTKLQWENDAISPKRKKLKESAEKMLGWDYSQEMRMKKGYADCSSFVHLALIDAGFMPKVNHPFTTYTMPNYKDYLEEISWDEIKVGDIILGDGHVAFYWGEDKEGHPITLESCGRFGVGYGYMMYGGWDFNYTSVWRVKNIDDLQKNTGKKKVKKVVPVEKGLVSIWDLVVDEKSLENHDKPVETTKEEK